MGRTVTHFASTSVEFVARNGNCDIIIAGPFFFRIKDEISFDP